MGGQKRLIFVVIVAYREPLAKTWDSTIRLLADVNFDLDQNLGQFPMNSGNEPDPGEP